VATHFSRLLRHAWVRVELFLFPGHHTGKLTSMIGLENVINVSHRESFTSYTNILCVFYQRHMDD